MTSNGSPRTAPRPLRAAGITPVDVPRPGSRPATPAKPGVGTPTDLAWRPGGDFTVGAEDEVLLVDAAGRPLGAAADPVRPGVIGARVASGGVTGEIFLDELELNTPVCADAEDVAASVGRLRSHLVASGLRPMAVGVHPEAGFGTGVLASSQRYDPIRDEFAGLFRTPTAAFQVHVGLPDTETALVVFRGLRNRLPLLRALAASSPFWHGADSGLASARSAIVRSYPRDTLPPALRSWDEYEAVTRRTLHAAEVPDHTYVWWHLRPQPLLGTLEVRTMDAQPSLARVAGLTALVQGLARHLVETPDEDDLPAEVLLTNDHRACRHGLDTTVVDGDGRRTPLRELATRAVGQARRALRPEGIEGPLDALEEALAGPSEPDRQRSLWREHGMDALLADLADRTVDPAG